MTEEETRAIEERRVISEARLRDIEAAINLIPVAGGFLATYFAEIRNKRAEERMLRFIGYFSERLDEIEEAKLDEAYLHSEEFAELFAQGMEEAARSTTEKRIRRFANILINNALLGAAARSRTQSIMSFVDRISDLDAFVLLCYGNPRLPSLRATSKKDAYDLVRELADYLGMDCPCEADIIESIIYMDNLGLTWVNEHRLDDDEKGMALILKEFSSFRTPLGDAVASVIAPPFFYKEDVPGEGSGEWPEGHVNRRFGDLGST